MNPVNAAKRPRYTICLVKASHAFKNYESFPYECVKPMAWNEKEGFIELNNLKQQPFMIYTVVDWELGRLGAIYQVQRTRLKADYYWWMYGAELGNDAQPHVQEHYWIKL